MKHLKKLTAMLLAFLFALSPLSGVKFANAAASQPVSMTTSLVPGESGSYPGGEVKFSVAITAAVQTKSFALDFSTAYDHSLFDWVEGTWSRSVTSLGVLSDVEAGSEAVFLSYTGVLIPAGEIFSFTLRVKAEAHCGENYEITVGGSGIPGLVAAGASVSLSHRYASDCDRLCDACLSPRTPLTVHSFVNSCDGQCDLCGETRAASHSYLYSCSSACSVCGEVRSVSHTYTDIRDDDCDLCGESRNIPRQLSTVLKTGTAARGDLVTVEFCLDRRMDANAAGLDLETAYDHSVFDWVQGYWAGDVSFSAYTEVTDGMDAIFLSADEIPLEGLIFTMVLRVKDTAECGAALEIKALPASFRNTTPTGATLTIAHGYDNVCDSDCNYCGAPRPSPDHEYDHQGDEACNLCGSLRLAFYGTSLSLQHNFAINYKVKKELLGKFDDFCVVANMNGKTVEITEYTVEENYLSFQFKNIAPQAIGDTVTAQLYAKENGVLTSSESFVFGVKEYCKAALEIYSDDAYAPIRTLIVDLLHYGAKAQIYTGYKVQNLADANLSQLQLSWGTKGDPLLTDHFVSDLETVENPTATWCGAGLVLDSAVTLKLKFRASDASSLTVRVEIEDGKTVEISSDCFEYNSEDGLYYLYVNGLNADQMSRKLKLTILGSDGTAVSNTAQYSIESYAYEMQDSTVPGLAELVKAMMNYGNSAVRYGKS